MAVDAAKAELRETLRARRRARSEADRAAVDSALAIRVGAIPQIAALTDEPASGCVTAYAWFGTEPRTDRLRAVLAVAGVRVLLPVIRADGMLSWADDDDELSETGVKAGIPEPTSSIAATTAADLADLGCRVVLAPALAVDRQGNRIGKAGGYYDRLIADLDTLDASRRPVVVAIVHDDEILDQIPTSGHDRRVDAVLTPSMYRRLP